MAYLNKDDYDCSIQDFTKAIQLNSDDALAYYCRGLSYGQIGEYTDAIEDYSWAIQLNPDFIDTLLQSPWLHLWGKPYRSMRHGEDIITSFHKNGSIAGFERITGIQLPADIAVMLTGQQ